MSWKWLLSNVLCKRNFRTKKLFKLMLDEEKWYYIWVIWVPSDVTGNLSLFCCCSLKLNIRRVRDTQISFIIDLPRWITFVSKFNYYRENIKNVLELSKLIKIVFVPGVKFTNGKLAVLLFVLVSPYWQVFACHFFSCPSILIWSDGIKFT